MKKLMLKRLGAPLALAIHPIVHVATFGLDDLVLIVVAVLIYLGVKPHA